jgi:hypothetical protein
MADVTAPDELAEAAAVLRAMAEHGIRVDDRKFERYVLALLAEYDRRGQIEQRAREQKSHLAVLDSRDDLTEYGRGSYVTVRYVLTGEWSS